MPASLRRPASRGRQRSVTRGITLGERAGAAGRWIGGSGKYDGIRGEFEIRVRPLRPANERFGQVIGSKQGSYRIARRIEAFNARQTAANPKNLNRDIKYLQIVSGVSS